MKRIFSVIFLGLHFLLEAQDRIDESQPKLIGQIKTLNSLTGWMKNDLGKWVSGVNAIPNYNSDLGGVLKYCEQVKQYALARVSLADSDYYCFAKFCKSAYVKNGRIITEYSCSYFVFDSTKPSSYTTAYSDSTIVTWYNFIAGDLLINYKEISWAEILNSIKRKMSGKDEKTSILGIDAFGIQYRYNKKSNSIQFLIMPDDLNCSSNGDGFTHYYEVSIDAIKNTFPLLLVRIENTSPPQQDAHPIKIVRPKLN